MLKTEKLLKICADSMKMPGWKDALSMMTEKTEDSCRGLILSDDELAQVAGGVTHEGEITVR